MGERVSRFHLMLLYSKKLRDWVGRLVFVIKSWFRDIEYVPVSEERFRELIEWWVRDVLPLLHYTPETFDCDDYSAYFKAWFNFESRTNACAEAIGEARLPDGSRVGHEWVGVLVRTSKGVKVVFVEPQTGEVFEERTTDGWDYYLRAVIA